MSNICNSTPPLSSFLVALEALLEELSFDAPERSGETVEIDLAEVDRRLQPILGDEDLSRYIL